MNIVIDIPKNNYLYAKEGYMCGPDIIVSAIKNGTPLPKVQADIFDKIKDEIEQTFLDDGAMQEYTVEECLQIIDKHMVIK